jgi:hypothetical protein
MAAYSAIVLLTGEFYSHGTEKWQLLSLFSFLKSLRKQLDSTILRGAPMEALHVIA